MRRPLKVMHVVFEFSLGGMEGGVLKLVNQFDRRSIASSICSCRPADSMKHRLEPDVALHEMNRKQFGNDPAFVVSLARLLRRERPDILHTHGWATLVEGVVAARLTGVKGLVHGEHGTLQVRNHAVQRFVWGRVDRVLSVSSTLAQRMAATFGFPLDRIRTIRNGVDSVRFDPARREDARAAMGLCADDVVVGLVGRLEAVKDQARLLEAAAVLMKQGLPFRLVIAGEGSLRASLEQQAVRLGLSDRTTFLGMRPDVENVMASLDIFVLCSTSEGLSNTILEAMASGVATVATDVGGARELLEDGVQGVLIPPSDTAALADAVGALVMDRDRRVAMGKAARERVQARFTLEAMVHAYEEVYEKVAGLRGLGGRNAGQG